MNMEIPRQTGSSKRFDLLRRSQKLSKRWLHWWQAENRRDPARPFLKNTVGVSTASRLKTN